MNNDDVVNILHNRKILLDKNEPIPIQTVYEWMKSPNLEVQGSVFSLLFEYPERLELPVTEEIQQFQLQHLEQCLRENTDGIYVHSRYMAGHTLRAWFYQLWVQIPKPEKTLANIRDMLARLCQAGDASLTDAVVTSILEHLFVNLEIRNYFSGWESIPNLREVYQEAMVLST